MTMRDDGEPATRDEVAAWARRANDAHDRFRSIREASERHRAEHGCDVYPTSSGPLLGVLASATGARRVLEVGCGLGYSAASLAHGSSPAGAVDTVERDAGHAALARAELAGAGLAARVRVHEGLALDVVAALEPPYDLIFVDSDPDTYPALLDHFVRLLRPGGLLATSNLFLAVYEQNEAWIAASAAYRQRILDDARLATAFLDTGLALSVRTGA